jgi:hypothetical protein
VVSIELPRLAGTREAARDLLGEVPSELAGRVVRVDASQVTAASPDFADELVQCLAVERCAGVIEVVGASGCVAGYLADALGTSGLELRDGEGAPGGGGVRWRPTMMPGVAPVQVRIGPAEVPYPQPHRPARWQLYDAATGQRAGEVWRSGDEYVAYRVAVGVWLDGYRATIADACAAVGLLLANPVHPNLAGADAGPSRPGREGRGL